MVGLKVYSVSLSLNVMKGGKHSLKGAVVVMDNTTSEGSESVSRKGGRR